MPQNLRIYMLTSFQNQGKTHQNDIFEIPSEGTKKSIFMTLTYLIFDRDQLIGPSSRILHPSTFLKNLHHQAEIPTRVKLSKVVKVSPLTNFRRISCAIELKVSLYNTSHVTLYSSNLLKRSEFWHKQWYQHNF